MTDAGDGKHGDASLHGRPHPGTGGWVAEFHGGFSEAAIQSQRLHPSSHEFDGWMAEIFTAPRFFRETL
ncbi:hypothetical protein OVA24_13625 [Luteolibacter sp. SL250]|uniref:hypothetical protein n=1 Tax=Luteolibacter sp. SL250 TaxID=2995170 RepID=UPI00226DE82A|nr:hypothetical protein [Luteolibacter sp. SL250]WAC21923.1 hypothetical protein OVA24_13625 [Luteolibacter sp. SL250]